MAVYYQYDVCKDYVGSVYVGGYSCLSKSELCVTVSVFGISGEDVCCRVLFVTLIDVYVFILCGTSF